MSEKKKNLSQIDFHLTSAKSMNIVIVVSQWNSDITNSLLTGAKELLLKNGAKENKIKTIFVPGSFELPIAADLIAKNKKIDAIICLGCVIQGQTRHFDFICQAVANGIMQVSIKHSLPVVFGVLTTNNIEQAIERSGGKHGNKGAEAAATAISMVSLKKSI